MNRNFSHILFFFLCGASIAPAAAPAFAAEEHEALEKKKEPPELKLPGVRSAPIRKATVTTPKPAAADGVKGAENFCAAIATSAAGARLAWQEERIRALQAAMVVKIAELDAKAAEVRNWVVKREQLLAKAAESLTAIYAKMKPEAASAQLQAMDDDTAAALLLKLKPSIASAVLGEMDPARAARLSDLLTGAAPKSGEKKS
ncbi:MotE family protein [Rhodoblastus sp.]|uniref:MotE family protein n=1 Tax=Rhodoblastus sp. TaxID=1962975 RepID=UPI003F9C3954